MERLLAGLLLITVPTWTLADPPTPAVPEPLPDALKPDFSTAKEIIIPAELLHAMLLPDPGPDTPVSKPFPLRDRAAEVGEIRFGSVAHMVLVGVCDPKVPPAPITGVRPVLAVDRFDLAKGHFLGSHPIPDKFRLIAVSPEVNLVLCAQCRRRTRPRVARPKAASRFGTWKTASTSPAGIPTARPGAGRCDCQCWLHSRRACPVDQRGREGDCLGLHQCQGARDFPAWRIPERSDDARRKISPQPQPQRNTGL